MTFYYSLFDFNMLNRTNNFVWFQNFANIVSDQRIHDSIGFTMLFTVVSMLFHFLFGIGLALMLNANFKARKALRTIALIPWAMPMIVASIAARWAFNDSYGIVNDLIRRVLPSFHFDWIIYPTSAKIAVIFVDVWKDTPFFAILVLASLQNIPLELGESARVDGASAPRVFWSITLPNLTRQLIVLGIFFTLWRITSFDLVYAMTLGGPANATSLLAFRISIESFRNLNIGYGSAIAVSMFMLMMVIAGLGMWLNRRIDY
jgi:multiple sugar transport system permease protein